MKAAIGKSSEKFAANLEQLKKESADQIRRSFDSISTLKDFISESGGEKSERYTKLNLKLDSVEKRLSRFEGSLNSRVGKLIQEYDKLKADMESLAKERNIYKALYEFSIDMSSKRDIESILPDLVQTTGDVLGCDHMALQLIGEDGSVLFQYNSQSSSGRKFKPSRQISDAVISTGDPVRIDAGRDPSLGYVVCVPLKSDETVLGLLHAVRIKDAFSQFDFDLLKALSEKIAISVESHRLFSELEESRESLMEDLREKYDFSEIIGSSSEMGRVLSTVADVAETESAILIEGESGTGKELLARAIHYNSRRKDQPFVAINCAAIPETLLESELFGYERGAFTGAVARKLGRFEMADNGTIFLDEIGELSPLLQVKLLRFLQSHEFEPLGSTTVKRANVRILSATKKDLMNMVESGEFRDDLFYRINVIAIRLPSLAERGGDIDVLANHFLKLYAEKNNKKIRSIDGSVMEFLLNYHFPGNVRELENIIERAVVLCKGETLAPDDLSDNVKKSCRASITIPGTIDALEELKRKLWRETFGPIEKSFALNLLNEAGGNISAAARKGGMHRRQLQRILKRSLGGTLSGPSGEID